MALRELLAVFDIQADTSALKHADEKIAHTAESLLKFGEYAIAAFATNEIVSWIKETVHAAAEAKDMADRLGVTTGELKKFQFAAGLSGASAEEASNGLRFLNKNMGEAITNGGEAAKAFADLHVNLKETDGTARPVLDVAKDLGEGLSKLGSQGERTAAAMKVLGRGGAALLPMFSEGSKGIEEAYEDFQNLTGGIGGDLADAADKADDQMLRLSTVMGVIKKQVALAVLPTFTTLITKMTGLGVSISRMVNKSNAGKVGLALLGAGAAFAAVRFLVLNANLVLMAAAVFAAVLIIEDLYTLFTGGDSVTGRFIDAMFGVGQSAAFVKAVKDTAVELWDALKPLGPIVEEVGSLLGKAFNASIPFILGAIKATIEGQVALLKDFVDILFKAIGLAGKLGEFVGGAVKKTANDLGISSAKTTIGEQIISAGQGLQDVANTHEIVGRANDQAARAPRLDPNTNGVGTRVTQNVDVKIDARGQPSGIVDRVVKGLDKVNQQAMQHAQASQFNGAAAEGDD